MAGITIADIAKALDLSPTTVSFVLNGRVMGISADTRERVLQKAHELNYRRVSRAILSGWTRVAYLIENPAALSRATTFFSNVYDNMRELAFEHRIETLMYEFNPDTDPVEAHQRLEMFKNLDIRVFLTNSRDVARFLSQENRKVILLQSGILEKCTCIYCDDYEAGRLAAGYLIDKGHRVAGTVFPDKYKTPRYTGFIEEFINSGGKCPEEYDWKISGTHSEQTKFLTSEFKRYDNMPTAIYCFADNYMYPVIRASANLNLKVPEDISLIGTDLLYWGQIATPTFSTIDLREKVFAEKVFNAIKDVLNDTPPYNAAVPVSLVPGETVKSLK